MRVSDPMAPWSQYRLLALGAQVLGFMAKLNMSDVILAACSDLFLTCVIAFAVRV